MSTKKSNRVVFPSDLGQPGRAAELSNGPKDTNRLTSNELITLMSCVQDRIRTIAYERWDYRDEFNQEAIDAARHDPYGQILVDLLAKLPIIISEALVTDLLLLGLKEYPKFVAALRLISEQKLWFSAMAIDSHRDLYLSLQERGYRWSEVAKNWLKFDLTLDALDGIRSTNAEADNP